MTKAAAIQTFFSQFMTAYPDSSVPQEAQFPWLTYTPTSDSLGGGNVSMTVNLWFYTDSEAVPNAKAEELSKVIGRGGVMIPCDGGAIWLKRGSPFCQSVTTEADTRIKRRYINLTAEFLTED